LHRFPRIDVGSGDDPNVDRLLVRPPRRRKRRSCSTAVASPAWPASSRRSRPKTRCPRSASSKQP
jgi:hypothetical protein